MKPHIFRATLLATLATLATLAILATPAHAQTTDTLNVESVLAKMLKASGEADAKNIHRRRITAKFSLPKMGLEATMQIVTAEGGKMYSKLVLPGLGAMTQGSNGEIIWDNNAMMGPRLLTGAEAELFRREARVHPMRHLKEDYESIKLIGDEKLGATDTLKILTTPKLGNPETLWIDKSTWLIAKHDVVVKSALGDIKMSTTLSDYRKVDGVTMAFKAAIQQGPQTIQITYQKVEHSFDLDPKLFDLPKDIKALAEAAKKARQ